MTLVSQEVPVDDMPDFEATTQSATDEPVKLCHMDGCPNPVGTGPSGRRLKYCAEHTGQRTDSVPRATGGRGWAAQSVVLETALNTYLFAICGGMQFTFLARDGQAIQKTGPAVVHEVVELARTDKALRDVLVKITAPGRYAGLSIAALAMLVSVAAIHIPMITVALPFIPGAVNIPAPTPTSAKDADTTEGREGTL